MGNCVFRNCGPYLRIRAASKGELGCDPPKGRWLAATGARCLALWTRIASLCWMACCAAGQEEVLTPPTPQPLPRHLSLCQRGL